MMDDTTVNANLNSVDCLVTKNHFGYDQIFNICTGSERTIDWAMGDWMGLLFLGGLGLLLFAAVAMLAAMAWNIATDNF